MTQAAQIFNFPTKKPSPPPSESPGKPLFVRADSLFQGAMLARFVTHDEVAAKELFNLTYEAFENKKFGITLSAEDRQRLGQYTDLAFSQECQANMVEFFTLLPSQIMP